MITVISILLIKNGVFDLGKVEGKSSIFLNLGGFLIIKRKRVPPVEQNLILGIIGVNKATALTTVIVITVVVINACTFTSSRVQLPLRCTLWMKVFHRKRPFQLHRFFVEFSKHICH